MTAALASAGGPPVRSSFLPFALPGIGEEEKREVMEVLNSDWITTGPRVKRFEEALTRYTGAPYAVCVDSGTAALHLALLGLHLKPGDEVVTTPLTFCSTVHSIVHAGGVPVLADVEPDTLNLSVEAAARAVTAKTKALLPVHFAGQPCDLRELWELGRKHDLKVVEDAAHAVGAAYDGVPIGGAGDAVCLSFYANKNITTGEGGALLTGDSDWAEEARLNALHGMSRDAWKRYTKAGSWAYEVVSAGFKYNMTDIEAALGLHQLAKLDGFTRTRRKLVQRYRDALAACSFVEPLGEKPGRSPAYHLFVVRLNLDRLTVDRARFIEELKAEGIGTTVHFIPIHHHPYYRERLRTSPASLPHTEEQFPRLVSLPLFPRMTEADVDDVVEAVQKVGSAFLR